MKKNVLRKDFFMEIRKTMGRFVSIFFIVTLGVAFYSGIRASEPSMRITGDAYFDKEHLMDIKVMGTMGLTADDIRAMETIDGIEKVEGGYSKDVLCPVGDNEKVVHMLSMQESFNTVQVKEGRLPEKAGECLLDEDFLSYEKFQIGDKVTFQSGNDDPLTDSLVTDTYTVVGIGNSPLYISFGRGNSTIGTGEVSGFVVVDESSFAMDVYTEAYAKVSGALDEMAFTDGYHQLSDAAVKALEAIEEERCRIRREEIIGEANEEVADAEDTWNEEVQKLNDAREELEEAKSTAARELEDARIQLEKGEAKLADSRKQIAEGEAQLASAKAELEGRRQELIRKKADYESGVAELNTKETELLRGENEYLNEYALYMPAITRGKEEVAAGKAEIETNKQALAEGLEMLKGFKQGMQETEAGISETEAMIASVSERIREGDYRFTELQNKQSHGQELTEEEQTFQENWPAEKEDLNGQLAVLSEQKNALEREREALGAQIHAAGFETTEALYEKVEELQVEWDALVEAEQVLQEKEAELLTQEQTLFQTGQQIAQGKASIAEGRKELETARTLLESGQTQLHAAWQQLLEKEDTLLAGKAEIARGIKELEEGHQEYEQGVSDAAAQIADAEAQISDGERKLTEAKQEIADARAEIEKIENPKWYVQDRSAALAEYDGYGENADRMRSIGQVFPVLFFLVAALISLTTMSRMVEEQRVQIGTMKALGYSKFVIARKYICYAFAATLGGSIFGVLIGEKIIPYIIIYAYKILYKHVPDILIPYHMSYALQATVIAVACTLFATVSSCYRELASQPAELMRPAAPKQGKRIFLERVGFVWKRLNFTWKSTVRNLIRYKKRFFMTIFGIGGCMALLLVGFGLKDCIYEIVELQFEKVQFYDASVYLDDEITSDQRQEILDCLKKEPAVEDFIQTKLQKVKVRSDSDEKSLYLMVPEDEERIEKFISYHSRTKDEQYSLSDEQVILTEKMANLLDVKVGDTIVIEDEDAGDKEVQIEAICENYLSHYLYLSPEKYEEIYGVPEKCNSIIYRVPSGGEETEKIGTKLLSYDHVLNVSYTISMEERLDDMLKSLNLVIIVLIVSAGMLAFVVLYNLNNINITERKRELATLKVLGFYDMEVASYVYRENILLTIIGSIAGLGLGNILHRFIIVTVEVNEAMFGRVIHWQSYLYSFLFTAGFSMFVNWVMFYKLRKIDMVESLKSVE